MCKKLLLTGIPATGKTTLGNFLAAHHKYRHIDMEDASSSNITLILERTKPFLDYLVSQTKGSSVVITWGFVTNDTQIGLVLRLKALVLRSVNIVHQP